MFPLLQIPFISVCAWLKTLFKWFPHLPYLIGLGPKLMFGLRESRVGNTTSELFPESTFRTSIGYSSLFLIVTWLDIKHARYPVFQFSISNSPTSMFEVFTCNDPVVAKCMTTSPQFLLSSCVKPVNVLTSGLMSWATELPPPSMLCYRCANVHEQATCQGSLPLVYECETFDHITYHVGLSKWTC